MKSRKAVVMTAVLSAALLVGGTCAVFAVDPLVGVADQAQAPATAMTQVEQTLLEGYCAPRMALADTESYGDAQFATSTGDLASGGRYAAFGSFAAARLDTLGTIPQKTMGKASADGVSVLTYDQNADDKGAGLMLDAALSKADEGTGAVGTTAAWATEGDLRGLSAASCVQPALEQSFLLGSTAAGTSQQLLLANPSGKATVVSVKAWGSSKAGEAQLATNSQMTVAANATATLSLSSALPGQDAMYVTVSSAVTPVAALVRHTAADGLTPVGNEYATPVGQSGKDLVIPGLAKGDAAVIRLFATQDTEVTVDWVGAKGATQAKRIKISAGKASSTKLDGMPDDARAVRVSAKNAVTASLSVERSGDDGQRDFALAGFQAASRRSATTVPDGLSAALTVVNAGDAKAKGTFEFFGADGTSLGTKDVSIGAGAAAVVQGKDIPGGTAAIGLTDDGATLVWSMRLTSSKLDDAGVAGLAIVAPTSLMPRHTDIAVSRSRFVTAQ